MSCAFVGVGVFTFVGVGVFTLLDTMEMILDIAVALISFRSISPNEMDLILSENFPSAALALILNFTFANNPSEVI